MHPIFVGRQDLCTLGECGINPVGLCRNAQIWGSFGPGSLGCARRKYSEYTNLVCVCASTPKNIFSDAGLVLCELREFVPPLVEHDRSLLDRWQTSRHSSLSAPALPDLILTIDPTARPGSAQTT